MFLSELQNKDIISVKTGANLGRIVDVEVNEMGQVIGFVAEEKKFFRKVLKIVKLLLDLKILRRLVQM